MDDSSIRLAQQEQAQFEEQYRDTQEVIDGDMEAQKQKIAKLKKRTVR